MSGIPFSADMVIANLEGRKDMTRRVVTPSRYMRKYAVDRWGGMTVIELNNAAATAAQVGINQIAAGNETWPWPCPYGKPGDTTYGKEALIPTFAGGVEAIMYAADKSFVTTNGAYHVWQWKGRTLPSIFMPRFLSRLALIIREVRVERLLAITDGDARREGFADREHFLAYWDKLNGKRGFESKVNPWVWVIGYEVE